MFVTISTARGVNLTRPEATQALISAIGRVGQTQRTRVHA